MKKAVMLIDYQNDFVNPTGSLYIRWADILHRTINQLIQTFEQQDNTVLIATQDWHPHQTQYFAESLGIEPFTSLSDNNIAWPRHCVANTKGAELFKIDKKRFDIIVRKWLSSKKENYSAFDKDEEWVSIVALNPSYRPLIVKSNLANTLKNMQVDSITIMWVATDFCVHQAVLSALKEKFNITVVENAIKEVFSENKQKIFEEWRKNQVIIKKFSV